MIETSWQLAMNWDGGYDVVELERRGNLRWREVDRYEKLTYDEALQVLDDRPWAILRDLPKGY